MKSKYEPEHHSTILHKGKSFEVFIIGDFLAWTPPEPYVRSGLRPALNIHLLCLVFGNGIEINGKYYVLGEIIDDIKHNIEATQ